MTSSWKNSFLTPPASMPSSPMKCTRKGLSKSFGRCRAISFRASCQGARLSAQPDQSQQTGLLYMLKMGLTSMLDNATAFPCLQVGLQACIESMAWLIKCCDTARLQQ